MNIWVKRVKIVWIVLVYGLLSACGGGSDAPASTAPSVYPHFQFVVNNAANTVFTYVRHPVTDNLQLVASVSTGNNPTSIVASPDSQFVYVANFNDDSISQYAVNKHGELTPLTSPTIAAGDGPTSLYLHPSGKYLYSVNKNDDTISQYKILTDGSLEPLLPAAVAAGVSPEFVTMDSTGKYLYVTNRDDKTIGQYDVAATGGLTIKPEGAILTGGRDPRKVILSADNKFAYVLDNADNQVELFSVSATGVLSATAFAPVATGTAPIDIAITSNKKYAYVVNSLDNTLSQYLVNVDGSLTPMVFPTVNTGSGPLAIKLDVNDQRAFVLNFGENTMSQYEIHPTKGVLLPVGMKKVATADKPLALTMTTSDQPILVSQQFAYLATDTVLSEYSVANNGSFTSLSPTGHAEFVTHIARHPASKYLYAENPDLGGITPYKILADGQLSALTPTAYIPYTTNLTDIVLNSQLLVHHGGKFLYHLERSETSNTTQITIYKIGVNGELLPTPVVTLFPFYARLALHPSGLFAYLTMGSVQNTLSGYIGTLVYSIDPVNGSLGALTTTPIVSGEIESSVMDNSGNALYQLKYETGGPSPTFSLRRYLIGGDGMLSPDFKVSPTFSSRFPYPVSSVYDVVNVTKDTMTINQMELLANGDVGSNSEYSVAGPMGSPIMLPDNAGKYTYAGILTSSVIQFTLDGNGKIVSDKIALTESGGNLYYAMQTITRFE